MRIIFDRKGTEIVHLRSPPQILILLWKGWLTPYDHQKSDISVNLDKTGPEIMHI